jgi:GntR family transcriptional regulator / MocR family aminotransferase
VARWELFLSEDALGRLPASLPLYARLAELISAEIRRGRLGPGARLPSSRALSRALRKNRNTVVAAYDELAAGGWIVTRPAGGTFVSDRLPDVTPRRSTRRGGPACVTRPGFELARLELEPAWSGSEPGSLGLFGGIPDLRLLPIADLARAYRRALRASARSHLDYAEPAGTLRLRSAVTELLRTRRGLALDTENVLVTRGSQMALDLLARALIRPGDRVAVEELGYQPAWNALRQAGAELVFVPVDEDGLDVDALARELERAPLRAIYLTPHHQYPTTAVLSPGRRMLLLELAQRERIAILEDDYDHEFHYDGRPPAPLASADNAGVVAYVGTFSKILAPGVRLGFVAAPEALIATLRVRRSLVDRQGDHVLEAAVAELIEDGILPRHVRRMRRVYHARRDAFVRLLTRHLGDTLSFQAPAGGMALWARAAPGVDVRRWAERGRRRGVEFISGDRYASADAPASRLRRFGHCLRLGFPRYDERELELAVRRMAEAL